MGCVFCGGGPLTNEHVIPSWLQPILRSSQRDLHGKPMPPDATPTIEHKYDPPPGAGVAPRAWSPNVLDVKVRVVCKPCNEGWMNDLEESVRMILPPMIRGQIVSLDRQAQADVAAWAFKTELMIQHTRPTALRCIGNGRYGEFFKTKLPPNKTSIWIGATQGGPSVFDQFTEANSRLGSDPIIPAFVAALALGNLLLIMAGTRQEGPQDAELETRAEPSVLRRIWPFRQDPVALGPPIAVIDGTDLASAYNLVQTFWSPS